MKKYTHLVSFESTTNRGFLKAFESVKQIPTVKEWNDFIEKIGLKNASWIVISMITFRN